MDQSTFGRGLVQNTQSPRIEDVLSRPNPRLSTTPPTSGMTRFNVPMLRWNNLSRWDDFNFQVLSDCFGDILNKHISPINYVQPGPFEIKTLTDLKDMCTRSILPRLDQPMAIGAAELGSRLNQTFPRIYTGHDQLLAGGHRRSALSFMADYDNSHRTHLVVSCVLHGSQWNSEALSNGVPAIAIEPIDRIATYCLLANTRYGFILTTQELVVVRVSGTAHKTNNSCQVEWQAIPWHASGPNVLTITLALWCLVMMSLRDTYRSICGPDQLLPLHRWWKYQNLEGMAVYHHHISMREVFSQPPGASVEERFLSG
ncbi:hypothetical protein NW762_013270 [Fusarium torreyae]|uniref:Uncharacterized protein n=1 Tax=Fusarium torreyae TaxID=1237075 RepID=A0A9W8VAG8_9HYPO|nr:hypothetical protein NW762_013270 [Fusarium torreyae]